MIRAAIAALLLASPLPTAAQVVIPCNDLARADAIPEPWADYTQTFANGEVRVALLDTIEPAVGALWLMIIAPPRDDMGLRQCSMVGMGGAGFADAMFPALEASYDPARGLVLTMPVRVYDPATSFIDPWLLDVTINQSTGDIRAAIR